MSTDDDQRQNESLHGEEALEVSAEAYEQTLRMARESSNDSEPTVEIPRPTRFGAKDYSKSAGRNSSGGSKDVFRHRSTPSAISVSDFLDENAVNPFELDLHSRSFASAADEKERDYYKPLPVADQMGRFARLPSTFDNIDLNSQRMGTILMHSDEESANLNIDLEAQNLVVIHKEREVSVVDSESETKPQDPAIDANEIPDSNEQHKNLPSEKTKSRSVLTAGLESFKYLYSLALLIFCVIVVTGTIFTKQTTSTSNGVPPIVAFLVFTFLIVWLATMEGGQGALVGLEPINKERYQESHPVAYQTKGVAEGKNLDRFIVGRQFLVVLVVFVSQLLSSSISDVQLWGLGDSAKSILLDSGLALMVVTIVLGQLLAQLNAANCMLDFINNYFMLYFITYPSLLVEFSGLLHSVYLVQMLFSKVGGGNSGSRTEAPLNIAQSIFFWARTLFSLAVLGFAFAVTLSALFQGQTTMWGSVPNSVSVVLFFGLMCFVGMMEGMQIAFFAVLNYPEEQFENYGVAQKNCKLTFRGENLQSFLIGRQICVTICTFIIARITTLDVEVGAGENIFGVSDGLQAFFNTGLLGAVITTIVSSLAWRIIASSFPLAFLSNPFVNVIIRLCLLFEASGLCSSAWVLSRYTKILGRYQPDEVYLENAEARSSEPNSTRDKDIDRFVMVVRFSYSLALFVFSVVVVMACIFTRQTSTTIGKEEWFYPTLVFVAFWFLIAWLAMIEGSLGCLLGLNTVEVSNYENSHPRTFKNTGTVYKGDNMQRFIVGRQFLVVVIVFISTWLMEPVLDVSVLGLPDVVNKIFLSSDLALVIILVIAGQLTAEVNAASCMLDFINNRFVLYFVTYLSLAIEYSGLLHSVYLVQILFAKISGQKINSNEPQRSFVQQIFFWARVLASLSILCFAFAVTFLALVDGQANLWKSLPDGASVVIILILISVVGMMEGVQIALFGVINLSDEVLESHKMAYANYKLTSSGQNLQAFLIGRQICVTCFFVLIARMSTLNIVVGADENTFGVSDGVQKFFNSGVLGALLTTIMASLIWRLFASSFPVAFMSNPIIYVIIWLCLVVEASGICSACWVFGRWTKLLFGYQPDPVYLESLPKEGNKPITRRDKDIDVTSTVIRYTFSTALLCFGIIVTFSLIFTKQTELSSKMHPAIVFFLLCFLLLYLATMEGGQGCLVGLQGIEKDLYKDSHSVTLKNTEIAHRGNSMQRFIVGRQFLVVLVVFIINLCAAPLQGSAILGLPDTITSVFVDSGVSLILVTVILGQLVAQVNAASCMLDFINNYFMLYFVTYVSMAIEMSGLLHCVYLVQILFSKMTGTVAQSNEPPLTCVQTMFFWGRAIFSLSALAFALAVTLDALFDGKTTAWESVPGVVSVIVFFVLMCIAGLMEGMQIALFAVVNLPENELAERKMAKSTCRLAFSGNNLQAFLIGRQIFVTLCTFVIARLTTLDVEVGVGENIFGVPDGLQTFFNTGLLGAIITTVVGSLAWRIIAASFPVAFLSNPLVYLILRLCLVFEASGICSAAWLLALINKQMLGYQPDGVYIGGAGDEREETAEQQNEYFDEANRNEALESSLGATQSQECNV
mmetsp:Transcript_15761/g.39622  ORF Transcript_15761/g.39622 Transcript_15761/m.39622 type:complete len:1593 (-) Transcript_15761:209-4987(-)